MSSGNFNIEDAGFNLGVNVRVRKRDAKTGRILEEREGHNRCLKSQLMGIVKWLNGEFNDTQPYLLHYDYIPRYLGIGTNRASYSDATVTTEVTVNDTMLLNEISPRIALPQRNTIINRSTQDYVQLVIVCYLPEENYNDYEIAEAGLFSKEKGNNCLFRITFDPILKQKDTVIEVNWTISVISVNSENQPYEGVDKSDLYTLLSRILRSESTEVGNKGIPSIYSNIKNLCNETFDSIYTYARTDATQEMVNNATVELFEASNILNDLAPGGELIPDNFTDTSDGTITANDVVLNKVGYSQGEKITGTMASIQDTPVYKNSYTDFTYETKTVGGVEKTYLKIKCVPTLGDNGKNYVVKSGTFKMDVNIPLEVLAQYIGLTPEKLKLGENVLGVTGTYSGGGTPDYSNTLTPTEFNTASGIIDSMLQESDEEETFNTLNQVIGSQDTYDGLGGTEEEINEILDETLN